MARAVTRLELTDGLVVLLSTRLRMQHEGRYSDVFPLERFGCTPNKQEPGSGGLQEASPRSFERSTRSVTECPQNRKKALRRQRLSRCKLLMLLPKYLFTFASSEKSVVTDTLQWATDARLAQPA